MLNFIFKLILGIILIVVIVILFPIIVVTTIYEKSCLYYVSLINLINAWKLYKKDVSLFLIQYRRLSILITLYYAKYVIIKNYIYNLFFGQYLYNLSFIQYKRAYFICTITNKVHLSLYKSHSNIPELNPRNLLLLLNKSKRKYSIDVTLINQNPSTYIWFNSKDFKSRFNTLNLYIRYFKNKHPIKYCEL